MGCPGCLPGCPHPSPCCFSCPSCCCWLCWCPNCPWSLRCCPSCCCCSPRCCCLSSSSQNFPQYLKVILSGLYRLCAVSDNLRHTRLYNRRVGVSWWLFLVLLRIASNVSTALQYDVTTSNTSGFVLLLNVLCVRYRRELFINKSVPFLFF